ncbi:MAG: VWA domain-containing protein [Planctomycetota bacterium]|nr:MAG: VWA domain-containing protein [Planctomycetota bacterium]
MNFANPLAFAAFAIAAAVIALYILKVRRRPQVVPYLQLWTSLVAETRARSLFQRLRRLLSLLLQLLILAGLVFALSRPGLDLANLKEESLVVMLDVSASMNCLESNRSGQEADEKSEEANQTTEGELKQSRFDLMMAAAKKLIDGRSFEDEMMLVAISDRVEVLTPFVRNNLQLRQALQTATPTFRACRPDQALAFAEEVTRGKEHPIFLVISDGDSGRWQEVLDEDPRARFITVGHETENLGILRFSSRKNRSLGSDHILAKVQNFGNRPQAFQMELALNGVTQKVLDRELPPGESLTERFQLHLPDGGTLRLRLNTPDGFAADNEAYAIVYPERLRRIVLVTPNSPEAEPFKIAFSSMAELLDERSAVFTIQEYEALEAPDRVADVTLCLNALPKALPQQGNLILMNTPLPEELPATEADDIGKPEIWDWDREHIVNRYMNYKDLPIPRAKGIRLEASPPRAQALVESYDGPLLAAFEEDMRKILYLAFDPTARFFPFRLAFPILLRNAIAWFEAEEDLMLEASHAPGASIRPLGKVRAQEVMVRYFRDGQAQEELLPVRDGQFVFSQTETPGAYLFQIDGRDHATSVNLFHTRESDLRPPTGQEQQESDFRFLQAGFFHREPWIYFAAFALLLWVLEWLLFHRRITE